MQDRFRFKFCAAFANFLCNYCHHAHAYIDDIIQVEPRVDLHDENTTSRVNQTELN